MYKIAVVPGDGIGPEVIAEGVKVLNAAAEVESLSIEWEWFPIGSERYLRTGDLLTEEDIDRLGKKDAIYFGAIGDPRVAPGILEKGILITMRTRFDQYVNMRPSRSWHPYTPFKRERDFDITFLRENTEDFYMGAGGSFQKKEPTSTITIRRHLYDLDLKVEATSSSDYEFAYEVGIMSSKGIERFADYAFEMARNRGVEKITAADKANICTHLYHLWRRIFKQKSEEYGIPVEFMYVDAMAMALVRSPERFGIVACPNMFGDILTDLGAEIMGGLGVAASGNINPHGVSMFEPVHGSAPDIAGQGKANPIAAILAAKMMIDQLGRPDLGKLIEWAVKRAMDQRLVTADMGGKLNTRQAGDAIVEMIRASG
ncbi:MAG: isocitrate/isopropylmalate dehydrogenase family protein [Methanomassiliicoccus sp.]|jgi:3-isopropylmalate dehydrogenase|nr:isocitrate/isopropylmalate dehydrogenase family protein [Methanomassiliicoccus sp.]